MVRTEFVGRDHELAVLARCLEEARVGQARLVLCQGEPGVGKTRLAEELLTLAAPKGVTGVWGVAVDWAGVPPYWPWRQVFRALADMVDLTTIADNHGLTSDLAGLAPELFAAPEGRSDPSASYDRFRQFDAVAALLRQVTRRLPLVIVFDDAHAADGPSLLVLHHVARSLRNEPFLLVVNHRDTEHRTGALLAELRREPITRQIHLRGLGPPAVRRQLASLVGHDVGDAEAARVHAHTGGNPFLVAEAGRMLAEGRATSGAVPVSADVREAIAARLLRLSPEAAQLLQAASVVGREFPVAVVAAMVDLPVLRCLGALDEAVAAGLVEFVPTPGTHRFAHALVRDAIEAALGTPERVRLHRLAAEAVEDLYGERLGPRLFDLARHWAVAAVAGERARATAWIQRAGREAMQSHAYEEAARLLRLALDVATGEIDELTRCRILLALGKALHLSSDFRGGLDASLEAAALARGLGRPDLVAEAALVMEPTFDFEINVALGQLCEKALTVLGSEHAALRTRVAARLAEVCHYLGDVEPARPASQEVLVLAEQCRDPAAVVAALHARQLVCSGPDGLDERACLAERMLAIADGAASCEPRMWGHLWRVDVAFQRGDLAGAARELDAAATCAHQVGGRLARWQVLRTQAVLAQAQARFDDARRLGAEALMTLAPTGNPLGAMMWAALLTAVAHHTGHDAESLAANGLDGPSSDDEGPPAPGVIQTLGIAFVLAEAGRLPEAAACYRSLGPAAHWRPTAHAALCAYASGISVAVALDASDDVATLQQRLKGYRGHHVVSGAGQVVYLGPVELWLGVAAAHLDLLDEAVADLEHAVKACALNGAAGFHVEAQLELAAVLARRGRPGDRSRARSVASETVRQATLLGMATMAAKASQLVGQLGARPTVPLTPREREVAELVAQGLTNREIAARLYLSERTAQNHVQHILTKLDLANRSQIALWVMGQKMSTA